MKGKLHKTEQGWMVEYAKHSELPLHPDDEHYSYAIEDSDWDGKEVEFEIVNVWERNTDRNTPTQDDFTHYAKLIPSGELEFTKTGNKESQKELIKEIMDLDAKDGLYDTVNELDKLAEETFKGDDATTFVQREIWKDGYKKAKETLYTEEDMLDAFYEGWEAKGLIWREAKKQFKESIKEFKQ